MKTTKIMMKAVTMNHLCSGSVFSDYHGPYRRIRINTQKFIIGGSCHKYHFCCDRSFVMTKVCLSQYNFCHNKSMLAATKH